MHVGSCVFRDGAGFVPITGLPIEAHRLEHHLKGSETGKSELLGYFSSAFCFAAFGASGALSSAPFWHCHLVYPRLRSARGDARRAGFPAEGLDLDRLDV